MSVNEPILQYDEKHALEIIKLSNKDRQSEKIFCDGKFKCRGQNVRCTQMCWSCVGFPSVSEMREKYEDVVDIKNMKQDVLEYFGFYLHWLC